METMTAKVVQHGKRMPNRAIALLLANIPAIVNPIAVAKGGNEQKFDLMKAAIEKEWKLAVMDFPCNSSKITFRTNERHRKHDSEDYTFWVIWGHSNGGDTLATITFSVEQLSPVEQA